MKLWNVLVLAVSIPLATGACGATDDGAGDDGAGPGQTPWNHDANVSCSTTDECGAGEICEDGICQMERCVESYASLAPMGNNHYFGTDSEFAVISDSSWVDSFEPADSEYINSWDLQSAGGKVLDVAGGNLTGSRPHSIAVAIEFSEMLQIKGPTGVSTLNIGMWPSFLATGDTDADSTDELVAFSEDGTIALCNIDEGNCSAAKIDGVVGKDVAVADIDGDGFDEALFLLDHEGESELIIWNPDAEKTEQEETYGWSFNFPVRAIAAGSISGSPVAEVVLLEDGGWWGWANDKLHVFSPSQEAFVSSHDINGHTKDVTVGDRNSDEKEEIAILTDDKKIELMEISDNELVAVSTTTVTVATAVERISMLDWNGDSASGRLVHGPELIAGKAVPIAALMFPPYPAKAAVGALNANITLGDTESHDESMSDTVSLGVGIGLKFGAEAFGFKAKVGGYLNKDFSYTERVTKTFTTGARYWVLAQPDLHGTAYAPVVMSCGCYHRYQYELDDPANLLGGSGQTVDMYMPVGGQTQLWSSKRYNAMAAATGTLPEVLVPVRVGDETSYPNAPQTLDGQPIHPDDMLFPETPSYQLSDVGFVSFWLQSGEIVSNEVAESTTIGITGSFGGGVVEVNTDVSVGVTQGYSISVGKSTLFAGGIPPVPDDPNTPEDEYEVHRYSFQPFVYRQRYTDANGEEAGMYVMHFAVNK